MRRNKRKKEASGNKTFGIKASIMVTKFDDVLFQLFDSVHVCDGRRDAVMDGRTVGQNCRSRRRRFSRSSTNIGFNIGSDTISHTTETDRQRDINN